MVAIIINVSICHVINRNNSTIIMGLFPQEIKMFYLGENFECFLPDKKLNLIKGEWYSFMHQWRDKFETLFFRKDRDCDVYKITKQTPNNGTLIFEFEGIQGKFEFSSLKSKYREFQINQILE